MNTSTHSSPSLEKEFIEEDLFGKIAWKAREHERNPKSKRWFIVAGLFLSALIVYALITQSPVMAITFILIGVVGYLLLNKEYPLIRIIIDAEGIHVGNEIYPYENIQSFWIFYEDDDKEKALSIHTNGDLAPFVRIPLGTMNPMHIRTILLQFLPERRHPQRLIDILEKYF